MNIQEMALKLEQLKGQRQRIVKDVEGYTETIRLKSQELIKHEQAKEIVREVGLKTQQQLQYHISDITSLALEAVFPDPYRLELEFVQRRNKTECDLFFTRNGQRVDPLTASGGGAVDVAAFALRIASWALQIPKSHNVIILDEPMRFLSEGYIDKASQMIKEISDKLGIQFIIITHQPKLAIYADRTFEVKLRKKISQISVQ